MAGPRRPRVLFYFLHLLGVGHVHRAQRLIAGMAGRGIAVDAVWGGERVDGVTLDAQSVHHLPPIRARDASYSSFVDDVGESLAQAHLDRRTASLLEHVETLDPDLVLIEAFPFGRRVVRQEILAMLDHFVAREHPPVIVSSVRDILQENRKPGRLEEAEDWLDRYFDRVLVHSDPAVIRLEATFAPATRMRGKLAYTGFVVPPSAPGDRAGTFGGDFDILVSAGGGAFGGELMRCAIKLARKGVILPEGRPARWLFVAGPKSSENVMSELAENRLETIEIVSKVDDLSGLMARSRVSISQCGYNTAMDVLAAQMRSECRAVFVPHDTTGQSEQARRAQLLAEVGLAVCIFQSQLTVPGLENALHAALGQVRPSVSIDFSGVETSARLIEGWCRDRMEKE